MAYRDTYNGTTDSGGTFRLYSYSLPLNPAKTVSNIKLPTIVSVVVEAITLF